MNENIVKLEYQEKEIYLVRTAHVSRNSVEDVKKCIEEVEPDAICVELDQDRYNKLKEPEKWRDTDIVKVIKDKQVGFLLVNVILSSFQKRIAKSMDSSSGAEMKAAMQMAEEKKIPLVMADRSIKTTFSRIWNELSGGEKMKLLTGLIESIFENEEISEEDINKLKETDALETALLEIGKAFPTVKRVLVDERDQYLSHKIKTAPGKKIVAVIGAAHAKGIERNLDQEIDIVALDTVNKRKSLLSYLKYLIPVFFLGLILYTIYQNKDLGLSQIRSWFLWHGSLSAIGVMLAMGHPLSVLTAFLLAPLTSLNPLLASGWFAGIMEASIRKPKVKDFEDIAEDTATLKGFWKNRVTRTLLVVIFANLFSSLGTFISGIDIIRKFIESF